MIASEDQNFFEHWGIDVDAVVEAVEENRTRRRPRGASTISQQVAKNLFLWPETSYVRKGIEAGLTLCIEALWPKARILEVYLNIAEMGPGIFGVEAAAQRFYGKPASRINRRGSGHAGSRFTQSQRDVAGPPVQLCDPADLADHGPDAPPGRYRFSQGAFSLNAQAPLITVTCSLSVQKSYSTPTPKMPPVSR